jgi:outer membrane protein OmpA-like peptidoglycan-associated protein
MADQNSFEMYPEFNEYEAFNPELLNETWENEVNRGTQTYIRWVQQSLNKIMGLRLAEDGVVGPQTRSAIRSFQQRSGLVVDGILGPKTEAAMQTALGTTPTKLVTTNTNCTVLDNFEFDRDQVRPFHQPIIINLARQIIASQASASPIRTVQIIGHTDPVGTDPYNLALGQRRAEQVSRHLRDTMERIKPTSTRQLTIGVESRGQKVKVSPDPAKNRRVEICFPATPVPPVPLPVPAATTHKIKVVVKSYIALIGTRIGAPVCSFPLPMPPPAPPIPMSSAQRLAGLSAVTDVAYSEDPLKDRADKRYRLLSECTFDITCRGGSLINVIPSTLITDSGLECIPSTGACLQPPSLTTMSPVSVRRTGANTFVFSWRVKGRPHLLAEPVFQAVCPRLSVFIWHQISGEVDCSGASPRIAQVTLVGSKFPSHRVFVNGGIVNTIPQGVFSNLWISDPADRTLVK